MRSYDSFSWLLWVNHLACACQQDVNCLSNKFLRKTITICFKHLIWRKIIVSVMFYNYLFPIINYFILLILIILSVLILSSTFSYWSRIPYPLFIGERDCYRLFIWLILPMFKHFLQLPTIMDILQAFKIQLDIKPRALLAHLNISLSQ